MGQPPLNGRVGIAHNMSTAEAYLAHPGFPNHAIPRSPSIEFFVEDRERMLRNATNVRRIKDLFSVTCVIISQSQGDGEWVTLKGASQDIERAKVCLETLFLLVGFLFLTLASKSS